MSIFSSNWTGRLENNFGDTGTIDRPPIKSAKALEPKPASAKKTAWLAEYAELAKQVGIKSPDMNIEEFKRLLSVHDIPVFALSEVIKYMDDKAAKESKDKAGWLWRPLRDKDEKFQLAFGRPGLLTEDDDQQLEPATDYFNNTGDKMAGRHFWSDITISVGNGHSYFSIARQLPQGIYDRTIPLHALRKVALIDKHWKGDVALFVSDYAPAPEIEYPDPFLMAVIPNPNVGRGEGRFVIDFWDEPGFGIDKMLKHSA